MLGPEGKFGDVIALDYSPTLAVVLADCRSNMRTAHTPIALAVEMTALQALQGNRRMRASNSLEELRLLASFMHDFLSKPL
jgi:hypothetical protein